MSSLEHMGRTSSAFTNVYYVPTDAALGKEVDPLASRHSFCASDTGDVHKGIKNHTGLPVLRNTGM